MPSASAKTPKDRRRGRGLSKRAQAEETRRALLEAGRRHFAASGYAATSTAAILSQARVTRGALYHHFADKAALLAAVCEQLYAEVTSSVEARAATGADAWQALGLGCEAFIEVGASPGLVQVLLVDGPSVLGRAAFQELERRHGFGSLMEGLLAAMAEGALPQGPVEPLAVLLNGAMNEAVYWAARQRPQAAAVEAAKVALRQLLAGLKAVPER